MVADALLLVSYGSPEYYGDVIPFLKNLFHGRNVSSAVLKKVADQYSQLALKTGQFSPLARQCRLLIAELRDRNMLQVPLFWGNLFWHPLLADTFAEMSAKGVQKVAVLMTSPFESEISRKRYVDAIEKACNSIGPNVPEIDLLPAFGNHPLYYQAVAGKILDALGSQVSCLPRNTKILFTAHSLPLSDREAEQYVTQLSKAAFGVVSLLQKPVTYELVFQSRSGKPTDPWLEPDICARIRQLIQQRDQTGKPLSLVIVPIGFLLENKETAYDLDLQVMPLCDKWRIPAVRVGTAGVSPLILEMIEQMAGEK